MSQFDEHKNDKLLIYDEDLIRNPKKIMTILRFLDIDNQNVHDLFKRYDFHKERGIKAYHAHSLTSGDKDKLKFHQKKIGKNAQKMTEHIRTNFPEIFRRYLIDYE